ncbi:putative Transmembrane protein [Quillaja saponaria]|uniref:Transmembrane protein n=1 Tax=Quillaja saponaria TaxID=32244 RepID=A0AAD7PM42_QUISA|nr:putative Transmembrane protein [Quillaja saponaria]
MGMVVVISLPLILFSICLGFGCYFLGRAKGRQDVRTNAQVFGVPTPPPGSGSDSFAASPPCKSFYTSTSPTPKYIKPDNSANV